MVSPLEYEKSGTHQNTFIAFQTDTIYAIVLAAGVEQHFNIPATAVTAQISATNDFYMKVDDTAAIPSTTVTDGSASELNPVVTAVRGKSTMSFISPQATTITVMFSSAAAA